jgi:ATP/maltotriose-dependent transcriptional regulator MalT
MPKNYRNNTYQISSRDLACYSVDLPLTRCKGNLSEIRSMILCTEFMARRQCNFYDLIR